MHPSLNSEFKSPPPLEPKRVMGRNEKCWCRSGLKWKKCHMNRQLAEPVPIGKLLQQTHKNQESGQCLHPDASQDNCSRKIAKAHTVQKARGLAAIADSGHVISSKKGFENIFRNEGKILPGRIGVNDASTFMGFCVTHDSKMFEPIESKGFTLNHEAAFLLAFRAISYEFLTKKNSIRTVEIQRQMDKGQDFERQVIVQQHLQAHLAGSLRGMSDVRSWKEKYDLCFKAEEYESIPHYAVEFDAILPFVCSGAFHPEVDFSGKRLQIISRGDAQFEHVCLNLTSANGKSYLVFGWDGEPDGPASKFVESFKKLPEADKANAALVLTVEQLENAYFNPSWWNCLSQPKKAYLVARMQSGIGFNAIRETDTYTGIKKILDSVPVSAEIGTFNHAF